MARSKSQAPTDRLERVETQPVHSGGAILRGAFFLGVAILCVGGWFRRPGDQAMQGERSQSKVDIAGRRDFGVLFERRQLVERRLPSERIFLRYIQHGLGGRWRTRGPVQSRAREYALAASPSCRWASARSASLRGAVRLPRDSLAS